MVMLMENLNTKVISLFGYLTDRQLHTLGEKCFKFRDEFLQDLSDLKELDDDGNEKKFKF